MTSIDEYAIKVRQVHEDLQKEYRRILIDTAVLIAFAFSFGALLGHLRIVEMILRKVGIL